jgi:hypothetical protein
VLRRRYREGLREIIVVPGISELPESVTLPDARPDHLGRTKFKPGDERTRQIATAGGKARAQQRADLKLITGLGVKESSHIFRDDELREYATQALEFVKYEIQRLARDVGGGVCPPPACMEIRFCARDQMFAAYYTDKGDSISALKHQEAASRHAIRALEHCIREAEQRRKKKPRGAKENLASRLGKGQS